MSERFVRKTRIEAPADVLFRWHAEPGALERLSPPWEPVEVIDRAPGVRDGDRGALRVHMGPLRLRWDFEHRNYVEGRQFQDAQIRGPFKRWVHTHRFTPDGPNACCEVARVRLARVQCVANACDGDCGKDEWCKNQHYEYCNNKPGPAICKVDRVADAESLGHEERWILAIEIENAAFPRAFGNGLSVPRRQVNEIREQSNQRNHANEDPYESYRYRIVRGREDD